MTDTELNAITERIIGCGFAVSNGLGIGFLERVYRNALVHQLRKAGLRAEPERPIDVSYDGVIVGQFQPDVMVEDTVIVELKATKDHDDWFTAQCLNYLKATGMPICLLLNFGRPKLDIKRFRR